MKLIQVEAFTVLYSPDVPRHTKNHSKGRQRVRVDPKINTKKLDKYVRVIWLHCLLDRLTGFTTMAHQSLLWSLLLMLAILITSLISS